MIKRVRKLKGFIADLKQFKDKILPEDFVAFQKWIGLNLYRKIMQKTPVDKGMLRGSWTISIGMQDKAPANKETDASEFDNTYGGEKITKQEEAFFKSSINAMADAKYGQIIWINNAMPYVLVIEFDGHSKVKAPAGMVQVSINEMRTWLKTAKKDFVRLRGKRRLT